MCVHELSNLVPLNNLGCLFISVVYTSGSRNNNREITDLFQNHFQLNFTTKAKSIVHNLNKRPCLVIYPLIYLHVHSVHLNPNMPPNTKLHVKWKDGAIASHEVDE